MQYLVGMNTFFPPTQPGNTLNSSPLCHTAFPNFSSYCVPLTIHFYSKFQVACIVYKHSNSNNEWHFEHNGWLIEQKNCEWNIEWHGKVYLVGGGLNFSCVWEIF